MNKFAKLVPLLGALSVVLSAVPRGAVAQVSAADSDPDSSDIDAAVVQAQKAVRLSPEMQKAFDDLKQDDSLDRVAAINKLGAVIVRGDAGPELTERIFSAMEDILTKDKHLGDFVVRANAAWVLGQFGNAPAVPALCEVLANAGEDSFARHEAAMALGHITDPRAVPALARALEKDADTGVRQAAAMSLGFIGGLPASQALRRASANDADANVRESARQAADGICFMTLEPEDPACRRP
jgi:HEAT repeat protein